MTMTENQKTWFDNMISEEIKQEQGTIDNEQTWANGSSGDTRVLHLNNAEEHRGYVRILEELRSGMDEAYEKERKDAVPKS